MPPLKSPRLMAQLPQQHQRGLACITATLP
ncbi:hypothetical protein H6G62_15330 [Phormidium sp. FACHB-1136]|nr:hypothetical protein [Phormidium sp. FACHB-1136]